MELYNTPELRTEFLCSLSVGGVDGTLTRRFRTGEHMGLVVAKTGSLANVSSLSGFAFPPDYGPVVFSIITNGIGRQYRADQVEDEIVRALLGT
jgi:D-alanyl-D-alanine carboxypeptidase/D-alanyl-D-alanine-endopeptidase (penicillin-binding protein 4)